MNQQSVMPTMMEAFGFTADDLVANQMGTATENQIAKIKATRGKWQTQIVMIIGLMILVGAAYIFLFPQGAEIRQAVSQNPAVAGLGIGISLLFYVIMLAYAYISSRSMTVNKVNIVSGTFKTVGKPIKAIGGELYQRIRIGKQQFLITYQQASAFTPNANYKAYFTGKGQMAQIVSIEPAVAM